MARSLLSPWSNSPLAFVAGISPNNNIFVVSKLVSTYVLVYVVDLSAFSAKLILTSVLVEVVAWFDFNAKLVSTSVLQYVVDLLLLPN